MLLQYQKETVQSETNSLKEYIVDIRNNIKKLQDAFNKMIAEQMEKYDSIADHYEESDFHYNEFYPATFNSSTFISLFSIFEFNLKSVCEIIESCVQSNIKVEDQSGESYIDKSKKYLELVEGLDLDNLDKKWQEIDILRKLRNCIIHNNSSIIKSKDKSINKQPLYQTIHKNSYLNLNEKNGIFIISNDEFILSAVCKIEYYLIEIIDKISTVFLPSKK